MFTIIVNLLDKTIFFIVFAALFAYYFCFLFCLCKHSGLRIQSLSGVFEVIAETAHIVGVNYKYGTTTIQCVE